MENIKEVGVIDILPTALYFFEKVHPLYIQLAEDEKKVYSSLLGKKKKAEAAKNGYERAIKLSIQAASKILDIRPYAVKAAKDYANSILNLYNLHDQMVVSRINVLKMFISEGLTDRVKDYNQNVSLKICSNYDTHYAIMNQQTLNYCQMFTMMGPFKDIHEVLDTLNKNR